MCVHARVGMHMAQLFAGARAGRGTWAHGGFSIELGSCFQVLRVRW